MTFRKGARDLFSMSTSFSEDGPATAAEIACASDDSRQAECSFSSRRCASASSCEKSLLVRSSRNSAGLVYKGIGRLLRSK